MIEELSGGCEVDEWWCEQGVKGLLLEKDVTCSTLLLCCTCQCAYSVSVIGLLRTL